MCSRGNIYGSLYLGTLGYRDQPKRQFLAIAIALALTWRAVKRFGETFGTNCEPSPTLPLAPNSLPFRHPRSASRG